MSQHCAKFSLFPSSPLETMTLFISFYHLGGLQETREAAYCPRNSLGFGVMYPRSHREAGKTDTGCRCGAASSMSLKPYPTTSSSKWSQLTVMSRALTGVAER